MARRPHRARSRGDVFGGDVAGHDGAAAGRAGPVAAAKTVAALDRLSDGRLVVGVGPAPHRATTAPRASRSRSGGSGWTRRFRACVRSSRAGSSEAASTRRKTLSSRCWRAPPIWIGSWGSDAGLRRVARLGDGWLASAYNTTPTGFRRALARLRTALAAGGELHPNGLATAWLYVTEDPREADRVLRDSSRPLSAVRSRRCKSSRCRLGLPSMRGAVDRVRTGRRRARLRLATRRRTRPDHPVPRARRPSDRGLSCRQPSSRSFLGS